MEHLRPNEQRAKNSITFIWIVLGFEIISLISGYFQYNLLKTASNGGQISIETATANDTRERIIAGLFFITYVISAVTFIQWFRRAYFNLHLKVNRLSDTEGWAAGSWFVPIVSLYRPYQIMKELYQETRKLLTKQEIDPDKNINTGYLGWWWTLWIINNIAGQISFRITMDAKSIDELTNSTIVSMIANIIAIPLALITVKVIGDYSKVEPLLVEIYNENETTKYTVNE